MSHGEVERAGAEGVPARSVLWTSEEVKEMRSGAIARTQSPRFFWREGSGIKRRLPWEEALPFLVHSVTTSLLSWGFFVVPPLAMPAASSQENGSKDPPLRIAVVTVEIDEADGGAFRRG